MRRIQLRWPVFAATAVGIPIVLIGWTAISFMRSDGYVRDPRWVVLLLLLTMPVSLLMIRLLYRLGWDRPYFPPSQPGESVWDRFSRPPSHAPYFRPMCLVGGMVVVGGLISSVSDHHFLASSVIVGLGLLLPSAAEFLPTPFERFAGLTRLAGIPLLLLGVFLLIH